MDEASSVKITNGRKTETQVGSKEQNRSESLLTPVQTEFRGLCFPPPEKSVIDLEKGSKVVILRRVIDGRREREEKGVDENMKVTGTKTLERVISCDISAYHSIKRKRIYVEKRI